MIQSRGRKIETVSLETLSLQTNSSALQESDHTKIDVTHVSEKTMWDTGGNLPISEWICVQPITI